MIASTNNSQNHQGMPASSTFLFFSFPAAPLTPPPSMGALVGAVVVVVFDSTTDGDEVNACPGTEGAALPSIGDTVGGTTGEEDGLDVAPGSVGDWLGCWDGDAGDADGDPVDATGTGVSGTGVAGAGVAGAG
eukprot:Hpha_TRINITY_DN12078_c0_g1::TRINITY_DN12078_c0_g1_i1::g.140979::m.140979